MRNTKEYIEHCLSKQYKNLHSVQAFYKDALKDELCYRCGYFPDNTEAHLFADELKDFYTQNSIPYSIYYDGYELYENNSSHLYGCRVSDFVKLEW